MKLDTTHLVMDRGALGTDDVLEWQGELAVPSGATLDPSNELVTFALSGRENPVLRMEIPLGTIAAQTDGQFSVRFDEESKAFTELHFRKKSDGIWEFRIETEGWQLWVTDRAQVTATITIGNKVGTQVIPLAPITPKPQPVRTAI